MEERITCLCPDNNSTSKIVGSLEYLYFFFISCAYRTKVCIVIFTCLCPIKVEYDITVDYLP